MPGNCVIDENSIKIKLFTIGHSNRSFDEFFSLLEEFGIRAVVDVRRYPSSRKYPHFNRSVLMNLLAERGVEYFWFEALGGRRHECVNTGDSLFDNRGLRSEGFRNYACHMTNPEFKKACEELIQISGRLCTTIMCAERLYWRCHRLLLSDYLTGRGVEVLHILEHGKIKAHRLTPGAAFTETGDVYYPQISDAENEN